MKTKPRLFKLEAVHYLIKNNVYGNEWQGAGMYEAIVKVMKSTRHTTKGYLDKLLEKAKDF